jgi:hypothetical protein
MLLMLLLHHTRWAHGIGAHPAGQATHHLAAPPLSDSVYTGSVYSV